MRILLVAGGSGGHLVPALALAERLQAGGGRCALVSTRRPVDRILSAAQGATETEGARSQTWHPIEWLAVDLQGFRPLRRWLSPGFAAGQLRAIGQVRAAIRAARPDAVVGFGGYLSAVAVAAARRQRIPAMLHEQNVIPGSANRWAARLCDAVAVSFPETARFFRGHRRVEVTGNPIRLRPEHVGSAEARRYFGFDTERPVLLVMGGSQGSRAINGLALGMWEELPPEERGRVQVLHLAGPAAEQVEAAYHRLGMDHRVYPFLHEMELALSAATLAVSRAGATAIAEMAAFGLPALLIPYPHAGRHQLANARWMERAGGAIVLGERGLSPRRLWENVSALLRDVGRLEVMGRTLRARAGRAGPAERADGSAAERLTRLVREVAGAAGFQSVRAELIEARTAGVP